MEDEVNLLKCVGNRIRFKILQSLKNEEKHVTKIIEELDEEQSLISHHLKSLRDCELIKKRREGRKTMYRIADPSILEFMQQVEKLSKNFCRDDTPGQKRKPEGKA